MAPDEELWEAAEEEEADSAGPPWYPVCGSRGAGEVSGDAAPQT